MASTWEYFVPGLNTYEILKGGYNAAKGAVNEQKQGDLTAAAQSKQLGQNLYTQAMQGLGQAEGYYKPAAAMLKNIYGSPGTMTGGPSSYPLAMSTKAG